MGATVDPEEVNKLILYREERYGGVCALLTGGTGSGKTNALGRIGMTRLEAFDEIIVWRSKDTCQWNIFIDQPVKLILWRHENVGYELFDRKTGLTLKAEKYFKEIKTWSDPKELVRRLGSEGQGVINVVQTIPASPTNLTQQLMFSKSWLRILECLKNRRWARWVTVCFDEIEDTVPQNRQGMYEVNLGYAQLIKELRKNKINFYGSAHGITEVDWRVRNKMPWAVYMKGTKPLKESKVKEDSIKKLSIGEAFVEATNFEKFSFVMVGKDKEIRAETSVAEGVLKSYRKNEAGLRLKGLAVKMKKAIDNIEESIEPEDEEATELVSPSIFGD